MTSTVVLGHAYYSCPESSIPSGIRWDVLRADQGQIVERSYGTFGRGQAGPGDPWMRVKDRSDGSTDFYKLAPEVGGLVEGQEYEIDDGHVSLTKDPETGSWVKEVSQPLVYIGRDESGALLFAYSSGATRQLPPGEVRSRRNGIPVYRVR